MLHFSSLTPVEKPQMILTWTLVGRLIRLRNQTGTWLLLLPTLWTLVLAAQGLPPWQLVVIFSLGAFLMRSAGVIFNDLADRAFDRHVQRTQQRPLASGELSPKQAVAVAGILVALAAALVAALNFLTLLLSPVALLLASLYPFAKRVVHVPQAVLGIAFGWGTVMAWAASRNSIDGPVWFVFAATICWAIGYDTIYALQDVEEDRLIGVKSSALLFGPQAWRAVGISFSAMLLLLAIAGWLAQVGWLFYGVLAAVGLFCLRQSLLLKRRIPPREAFHLFQQHVWVGTAILAGLIGGFAM